MKHEFAKPYEFDGRTFEFIEVDLESMKGSDIKAVNKKYNLSGEFSALPTNDSTFCALLLAQMTHLPIAFFDDLPAVEYCELTQKVSNFLNQSA